MSANPVAAVSRRSPLSAAGATPAYAFVQARLRPLGNTFLNANVQGYDSESDHSDREEEPIAPVAVVRRRRSSLLNKSHSIPEYIPHDYRLHNDEEELPAPRPAEQEAEPPVADARAEATTAPAADGLSKAMFTSEPVGRSLEAQADAALLVKASLRRQSALSDATTMDTLASRRGSWLSEAWIDSLERDSWDEAENSHSSFASFGTSCDVSDVGLDIGLGRCDSKESFLMGSDTMGETPDRMSQLQDRSCSKDLSDAGSQDGTAPNKDAPPTPAPPSSSEESSCTTTPLTPLNASHLGAKDGLNRPTTLIIRNIPHDLAQNGLADALDQGGFKGLYDFLYMPSTFGSGRSKGYAFVNCLTPDDAARLTTAWHNTRRFDMSMESPPLHLSASCLQGREANMARWQTSKMRRIRNPNHRPLVLLPTDAAASSATKVAKPSSPSEKAPSSPGSRAPSKAHPASRAPSKAAVGTANASSAAHAANEEGKLIGQWCVICGLTKNVEANGLWGFVQSWDASSQRYMVNAVIDAQEGTYFVARLLPQNLVPADECKRGQA